MYQISNESRILIIRLRFLGDVLLTTPLLKAIKIKFPKSYIAYLAENNYTEVLQGNPFLDEIFSVKRKASLSETFKLVKNLRKNRFDLVIDLFGNPRSAIITYLTGAKIRVGFNYPFRRKLYNLIVKDSSGKDAIDVYLNVLKNLGVETSNKDTYMEVSGESEEFAENFFKINNIKKTDFIVGLNPGGSSFAKRWGINKYAGLGNKLMDKHNAKILIFEGYKEIGIAKEILEYMGTVPFSFGKEGQSPLIANNLTIKQLASLIKRCSVFITNDAGPMHVAAAVSTPTIAIFGPGEPDIWFPYTNKKKFSVIQKKLQCAPCNLDFCEKHTCMELVTVEDVLGKIEYSIIN